MTLSHSGIMREEHIPHIIDITIYVFIIFSVFTFFLIWKILNVLVTLLPRGIVSVKKVSKDLRLKLLCSKIMFIFFSINVSMIIL